MFWTICARDWQKARRGPKAPSLTGVSLSKTLSLVDNESLDAMEVVERISVDKGGRPARKSEEFCCCVFVC